MDSQKPLQAFKSSLQICVHLTRSHILLQNIQRETVTNVQRVSRSCFLHCKFSSVNNHAYMLNWTGNPQDSADTILQKAVAS